MLWSRVFGLARVLIGHKLIACGRLCDLYKINAHALLPQQYQIARVTGLHTMVKRSRVDEQPLVYSWMNSAKALTVQEYTVKSRESCSHSSPLVFAFIV